MGVMWGHIQQPGVLGEKSNRKKVLKNAVSRGECANNIMNNVHLLVPIEEVIDQHLDVADVTTCVLDL